MRHVIVALAVLSTLAGCSKPTPPNPDAADLAACKAAILDSLVDPESARFDEKYKRIDLSDHRTYMFQVNSKNRMGGYVGKREVACSLGEAADGSARVTWM